MLFSIHRSQTTQIAGRGSCTRNWRRTRDRERVCETGFQLVLSFYQSIMTIFQNKLGLSAIQVHKKL